MDGDGPAPYVAENMADDGSAAPGSAALGGDVLDTAQSTLDHMLENLAAISRVEVLETTETPQAASLPAEPDFTIFSQPVDTHEEQMVQNAVLESLLKTDSGGA